MTRYRSVTIIACMCSLMLSMSAHPASTQSVNDMGYSRGPAGDANQLSFVLVNGVKLAYRVQGSGLAVVFVHGEGYSHEEWTEQIDAFSHRYQVVSYDRRGHGLSDDPVTGYSETAHAEDLNALLQYLGIREAHFVVSSRGGAIIIQFLKLHGEKVRSITFADATIPLVPISDKSAFKPVIPHLKGPPPTLQQALEGRENAKKSPFTRVAQSRPETRTILGRMLDQYSPRVVMDPQRLDMSSPTHIGPWNDRDFPDMSKIHQPIFLIVAELSDIFFKDGAAEADRLWPNTRLLQIPAVDHLFMLEDPQTFNRVVLDFLAEVDGQIAGRERRSAGSDGSG